MEVVFYGNGEAVEGTDELLGLCEVLVPRASSGDGEVEEGFGKTVRLGGAVSVTNVQNDVLGLCAASKKTREAVPIDVRQLLSCRKPW